MSEFFGLVFSRLFGEFWRSLMMILLITISVTILIQIAGGKACIDNGTTTTFIDIFNCNSVSYQNLLRNFQTEKIANSMLALKTTNFQR